MLAKEVLIFLVIIPVAMLSPNPRDCNCKGKFTETQKKQLQEMLNAEAGHLRQGMMSMCPSGEYVFDEQFHPGVRCMLCTDTEPTKMLYM